MDFYIIVLNLVEKILKAKPSFKYLLVMDEISIRNKPKLGAGEYHNVYNYEYFKDKVIKTRKKGDLNLKEMEIFQKYPQFFAKVYKVTPRYAILEKLDVKSFKEDELKIGQGIWRFVYTNPKVKNLPYWIDPHMTDESDIDVPKYIWHGIARDKNIFKPMIPYCPKPLFSNWINWFIQLDKLNMEIDVHDNNFGYNKEGELRLLDI